ncbi:helix-turn-helix domain-containing protein [uncultured Clostridium sp.]|uniref:helix-turn-helix domain-containing protein n=1 Tax=uncultured Clostridium sp. TaxID=59620 RepID=UPI00262607F3|nr:helix-turn-helix transcriptional regulator [uncultured Clostridium sp.]
MDMKYLDTFGKRLEFLLDLKDIQKKQLAEELNISPTAVTNYIKDNRKPDLNLLAKIAKFLNVNSDFLLMLSDDYQTYVSKKINGDLFEITFDDEKLHLTEKEIEELFAKLKSVGFDVKKLL